MFCLKKGKLLAILFLLGFSVSAQHIVKDSLNIWRAKNKECTRFVDSVRIIAVGEDDDHQELENRLQAVGDSLNRLAGRDFANNIHNDPFIDSLNQKMATLSLIGMFLNERFEYHLVLIDSCLGVKKDFELKIYNEEHKKVKNK
jgi:hypothetical protein